MQVMTSMRVVRRQGLAPAIVKEASAIKATRVVVGSAGWFVQQRSRDLVGNWTVMLAFIETRLPSECLIMMVDDGRLAAVKRGKASGANGAQGMYRLHGAVHRETGDTFPPNTGKALGHLPTSARSRHLN